MLFAKRFDDLAPTDFEELCRLEYPESDQLELKEFVPGRGGPDKWHSGADGVSDYGRNELLAEIIGLANTRGGHLIIGIAESKDAPKRAIAIRNVCRCVELADKLRQQTYACIEPRLADIQFAGIPLANDGSGVVVVRIRQSSIAPHRLEPTKDCYVRRGESTQRMTMREIQDLTLNSTRGFDFVTTRMQEFREAFEARAKPDAILPGIERVGFRASAVPIQKLALPRIAIVEAVEGTRHRFQVTRQGGRPFGAVLPAQVYSRRPILRGHMVSQEDDDRKYCHSAFDDGSQSAYLVISKAANHEAAGVIFEGWVVGLLLSVLGVTRVLATAAGSPTLEFALNVQLTRSHQAVRVWFEGQFVASQVGQNNLALPTYSYIPEHGEIQIVDLVTADLRNATGLNPDPPIARIE
ncbi:MAG: helix-turn-helix domain-containing protein [Steroidobacteraceae bacterium]